MDDDLQQKREPLAALHIYEPTPTHKLFPHWEWVLKCGWLGALAVAGLIGHRFLKPESSSAMVSLEHFGPATRWTRDANFNLAPAISHDGKLVAYASDRE